MYSMWVKANYPNYKQIDEDGFAVGLIIPFQDTTLRVTAGIYQQQLYCQIDTRHFKGVVVLSQEAVEKAGRLLPRKSGNDCIWKDTPRHTHDETFRLFCEIVSILTAR